MTTLDSDSTRPITIPETLRQKASALAERLQQPLEPLCEAALQAGLRMLDGDLEMAAEVFLHHIHPDQAALIRELCREYQQPAAAFLLQYIQLAHDRRETSSFMPEGQYQQLRDSIAPMPDGDTRVCEWCGQRFPLTRRGQKYCPPPAEGESCGRKAFLDDLHRRRPQTRAVVNPNAPKALDLSTIQRHPR
jgi:hypothetical protein